jgi:WD40 repeat protein
MLATTVKFGGNEDLSATQPAAASSADASEPLPAAPSPGAPTRTCEPLATATPAAASVRDVRRAGPPQPRDPERYQIIGEHGRGGLGRVSRAHDHDLGRDIAIKELISRGHVGEVRFLREALITARLEHPGIVPIYEAGRWPDGTPFYAMKLVAGRSLRELIVERKTVEQRIGLLHHVIAVADAIAYAHGRNIIHRDLKPANVIVGDFGETIVIDWGLAKDLTAAEESTVGGGPFLANRNDGLTSTGSVLGTPAYMAPEQERGEHVDQRADVFAIGAMLWELCALQKVPPTDPRLRHRMLRRAGIDKDLITIIDKALDPDPGRRYADAGALAADLKAFKSGARIAARSYSLWAMLTHWTRRHRTLALSAIVIAALVAISIAVYVRNIAVERDRGDAALARTEAAKDDLTLEHAALLLHSDPTAAVTALSGYRGNDDLRRRRLLAEAIGLGVATKTLEPHSDTIWFLLGEKSGTIVSLGEDGRIQSTRGDTSTPLATDVSLDVCLAYAPSTGVLAYATSPAGIALLRMSDRTFTRIPNIHITALRFAPDGSRLAAITDHGELIVWSVAPSGITELYRASLPGASRVLFMTPARILVQDSEVLRAIPIDPTGGPPSISTISNVMSIDTRPDAAVIGTSDGNVELLSTTLDVVRTTSLCHGSVNIVQFVPGRDQFVLACHDGHSQLMRFNSTRTTLATIDTFPTHGSTYAKLDTTGQYVTLIDESRTAYIYHIETRLVHRYEGHAGQPTCITAPTPEFDHVLTGDANGTVRLWEPPMTRAHVVLQAPVPLYGLAFGKDSKTLLTNGNERIARGVNIANHSLFELPGHAASLIDVQIAPDGSSMLTYGYDATVRVWRATDLTLIRSFKEHRGLIGEVGYINSERIVSVGDDGQLLQWSPGGTDVTVLFKSASPLRRLEVLSASEHVVVDDRDGAVWDVAPDHVAKQIRRSDGEAITVLRASPDGKFVALGMDSGVVVVYDTSSWQTTRTLKTDGGIRQIVFDPFDRDLLIASEARHSQIGHVHVLALDARRTYRWSDVTAAVRDVAYAPDGDTLGFVCADGGTWLYSMTNDAWIYANDEHTDTLAALFSADGQLFASADRHGTVVVRDVASSFNSFGKFIHQTHP